MIKYLLFDFDGTLFNTSPGILNCMKSVVKEYNVTKFSLEDLHLCIGPPISWTFETLFGIPKETVPEAIQFYRKQYNAGEIFNIIPYEGMEECLKKLHQDGYFLSVCSSKPKVACEKILNKFHWEQYFDDICGAIPEAKIESKEDVLEDFFKKHPNADSNNTILIGDTKYDALGAKNFHMGFLAVDYGFGSVEEMKEIGANAIVSSPVEVCRYIESI